ncbi:MAG: Fmu (Sun) domain protein [Sphingobacteriia bacterium]|nr:MAG: Fmu (Sun) domain protein [Sphingobacteriia bacterium]
MKYANAHFQTALGFLADYDGSLPLAVFLKQQFALSKKYGSKDRRSISALCYAFFRAGQAFKHLPLPEALCQALALQPTTQDAWKDIFPVDFLPMEWSADNIFPFAPALSTGIDSEDFALSHLHQPKVYLRVRPGKMNKVKQALVAAGVEWIEEGGDALSVAPGTDIEKTIALNRDAVVQDISSQRVAQFFKTLAGHLPPRPTVWDCCAASGGKSILATDHLDRPRLTVSDIRPTILRNLHQRMAQAGIALEKSFVADLTKPLVMTDTFDLVICDAPCSGSGTWSRTPEQLYFYAPEKGAPYAQMQTKILQHVLPAVKQQGFLLYLTCSVFQAENEDHVKALMVTGKWELVEQRLLTGYHQQADTLFGALLRKK